MDTLQLPRQRGWIRHIFDLQLCEVRGRPLTPLPRHFLEASIDELPNRLRYGGTLLFRELAQLALMLGVQADLKSLRRHTYASVRHLLYANYEPY